MADPPSVDGSSIQDPTLNVQELEKLDFICSDDKQFERLKAYARSQPYPLESNERMQKMLDFILLRMAQCILAKSFDPGFLQWDSMLTYWRMLKYPIPKEKRIAIAKLYLEICVTPFMPTHIIASCSDTLNTLLRSKNKLSVDDLRLPWKSLFMILKKELFLSRRQFEISQIPYFIGYISETCRRFFHPACTEEILEEILPLFNGTSLDSVLATEYYLLTFLPLTHPQIYLPALFRLWESINSYMYDDRMLGFLAQLAEVHTDPSVSDPARMTSIPDDAIGETEVRLSWNKDDLQRDGPWNGIWKDVGIFTVAEWGQIMCKTLSSMEISLADTGSLTTGPSVDTQSSFELGRLPRAPVRINSLAKIIVYSMHKDGPVAPASGAATPFTFDTATDYFGSGGGSLRQTTFVEGSRALDSLIRMILSTENFFHPSNAGDWTSDLSSFIRSIAYEFNKRWFEEQLPTCRTPRQRRLTPGMRRELVKCLRTVALLGLFSTDTQTVGNILSCLKSLVIMEPDLIITSILERAAPSLEALTETRRTTAMIKALSAVAAAIVSRDIYYPGAKHLLPILDLLTPGIDSNDPTKTLCTTLFLIEISSSIRFGEILKSSEVSSPATEQEDIMEDTPPNFITVVVDDLSDGDSTGFPNLTRKDEDDALRHTSTGFADWVTTFIRRVILLMENLPEEKAIDRSLRVTTSDTDVDVVDAVIGACSQICCHLSDSLYDVVLNLVYEYASSNVRSNAVRAIHTLLECLSVGNPLKTVQKFVPFCVRNIRHELEHGASSLRTTSVSVPLPSDATLHWNIAILRGAVFSDGTVLVGYKLQLMDLFKLLHSKAFSKRGFSWTGKLMNATLYTLTHTYPIESRFVDKDIWNSPDFESQHHLYWGKLYERGDCKIEWHIPNEAEVEFALDIFREIVEPALDTLDVLLDNMTIASAVWRNDFCRSLSLCRYTFSGVPTLFREYPPPGSAAYATETSDLIDEIPEFIASVEQLNCGFSLNDRTDSRWQYMVKLKQRFGLVLCKASKALRLQGTESTIDALHTLIRSMRTFMLEYGDSRESYFSSLDSHNAEKNMGRRYAKQRMWSRSIHISKARLYHAARLRWNSIDRYRGPIHDSIIDELTELCVFPYPSIRSSSQGVLESLMSTYDGIRRRCLPTLYQCLEPGNEDDRMKGALYTLNLSPITRYIMSEVTCVPDFVRNLLGCQHNEKPSIQDCVGSLVEAALGCFAEPCHFVYTIPGEGLSRAADRLKSVVSNGCGDSKGLIAQGVTMREHRIQNAEKALRTTCTAILDAANDPKIHWKYSIGAIRLLRTLVRKDMPLSSDQMQYFLRKTYDDHPSMRYYAQRAVMKALRYIKLRSISVDSSGSVTPNIVNHPLKRRIPITATHEWTAKYLQSFHASLDWQDATVRPQLQDKVTSGWLTWAAQADFFLAPTLNDSPFLPWESSSMPAIDVIKQFALDPTYWERLSVHFSEENSSDTIAQDNVSCVKSIFQILEDEPLSHLKPVVERLLRVTDQNKQRAAAEMIAAVIGGSKHWPQRQQTSLWKWISSLLPKMLGSNVKTDTLLIWTTFIEYVLGNRDPRRVKPIVDFVMSDFLSIDFDSDSFFAPMKISSFIRSFSEEVSWRFRPWVDTVLARYRKEMACDHDEVRSYISEAMQISTKIKWSPRPSQPTTEVFMRECRILDSSHDIMGIRAAHDLHFVQELSKKFPMWREQRLPGAKAQQSTYDKVGIMTCKWLYVALIDLQAIMVYDLILPLMPELFRFSEVNDNEELTTRASMLLTRMCAVSPPADLLDQILNSVFQAIRTSTSWRVRVKALPLVQIWYFRQYPLMEERKVMEMLEVCCGCLNDEVIEVREAAATTLSGILRCSPRRSILLLKNRFVNSVKAITLPPRTSPNYGTQLRKLHGAILGVCALIESFPYTVEKWTPELLTDILAHHTYDPIPVSTTVRACAASFKKTHQDTWHEDQLRFNDEQLSSLSTLLTGSSYYA